MLRAAWIQCALNVNLAPLMFVSKPEGMSGSVAAECSTVVTRDVIQQFFSFTASNIVGSHVAGFLMCYAEPSPSSTPLCLRSRPNGGKSFSVSLWGRPHRADDTRGICRSIPGFRSTEPRRPTATTSSGSDGTARRRWCWHRSQAYLPLQHIRCMYT